MFIDERGSWISRPSSDYPLIFLPFRHGQRRGLAVDVLRGFLDVGGATTRQPRRSDPGPSRASRLWRAMRATHPQIETEEQDRVRGDRGRGY